MRLDWLFVLLLVPGLLAVQASFAAPAHRSGQAARVLHRVIGQPARTAPTKPDTRPGGIQRANASTGAVRRGPARATDKPSPITGGPHLQPRGPAMPASTKDAASNANAIDLRGGLPSPKDAPKDLLHERVQQIARQVQALGVKATIAKPSVRSHDHAQTAGPGAAGDRQSNAVSVPPAHRDDARWQAVRTDLPPAKSAVANATAGVGASPAGPRVFGPASPAVVSRAANAAVINGTGTPRTGVGPGTVGGAARMVLGVNGTAIRAKR